MSPPLTAIVWLLTAVAMTTGFIPNPGLSCGCFRPDTNIVRSDVDCGRAVDIDMQAGGRGIGCERERRKWMPPGYRYVASTPALYKLYRVAKSHDKAEQMCRADGGHLAVPKNKEQADLLVDIIKDNPAVEFAYIGIDDIANEGTFVTATGEAVSYLPFSPGNAQNDVDCVMVNNRGEFITVRCRRSIGFICQRDLSRPPPEGYRYVSGVGFYKHYTTTPLNYQEARDRCKQDGGHLAVIDSEEEIEALSKFYDDTTITESYVGLNDLAEEGEFVSETGKPVEQLPYTNWNTNEPNNARGNENCVTLHIQGNTNDVNCDLGYPFFCEFPLPD